MKKNNANKRWYDQDPTVSLAVSIIRNTNNKNQKKIADYLIEKGKGYNIKVEQRTSFKLNLFNRRWYDFDEKLHLALEYLRYASPDIQKALAIEVINYLCTLDNSINTDKL